MCAVSMVSDHWREKWPQPLIPLRPYDPFVPEPVKIVPLPYKPYEQDVIDDIFAEKMVGIRVITVAEWEDYQRLKEKAEEYDARTNQPDCVKPDVDAWEQDIEAFLILMGLWTEDDDARKTAI